MKLLPVSAAWRIASVSALAFAIATLALGLAVHVAVHAAFENQLEANIRQASASLVAEYRDEGMAGLVSAIAARERSPSNQLGFAVFSHDGKRLAGSLDSAMPATGWQRILFTDPEEGPDPAQAYSTDLTAGMRLTVAADLEPVETMDETILAVFGFSSLVVLAIGALLAICLARYLKQRLGQIARGAQAFAIGDYGVRAEVGPRGDEFDQLAGSINAMLDRIEGLLGSLRQVTSDLAHDMRTPLANLRGQLEAILHSPESEHDSRTQGAIAKCDDILRMFGAILRISELEAGELHRHFQPVDLQALAAEIVEAYELPAEEAGQHIALSRDNVAAQIPGDRDLLAQALVNLVENALHHASQGKRIEVSVAGTPTAPCLVVRDHGPGIAPQDRCRATERFVRLDAARTTPGHGLGLSLVKAIAEAHGARLALHDAGPGLEARILFGGGSQ